MALKFNLRRYHLETARGAGNDDMKPEGGAGRGLHSFPFQLNLSTLCGIGGAVRGCLGVV
jgi:hypothetical protein